MNNSFNLKDQMAVNVKWVGVGQIIGYILQFVVWAILARLLQPNSFGALGVALAFLNFVLIFNELGLGSAIIQRKNLTEKHMVTTFWVCIMTAVFFLILAVSFSSPIAKFFRNLEIGSLIIIFSLKLLVDSFGVIHEALLKRELLFKKLTFIEIYSNLLFGIVAITMAFKRFGIISMAYGYLAKSVLKVILLWCGFYFRPRLEFDKVSFSELYNFGRNIVGFKIVSYFSNNIDILLIAKFLGTISLGYYSLALNLINFPRQKLSFIVSEVAFPVFSKIQDHLTEVRGAYNKLIRYAAVMNFPLLVGLMFTATQFVRVVYSAKWSGMVLALQILCIYGICFSITTFVGIIFNSTGHPEYSFKFSLVTLIGAILAVFYGLKYGLVGVALALSIYAIIMNIWGHLLVRRIIKMNFIPYLQSMIPAIISSGTMSLGLVLFMRLLRSLFVLSDLWLLLILISGGAVIYILTLFLVSRQTFREMIEIASKMF